MLKKISGIFVMFAFLVLLGSSAFSTLLPSGQKTQKETPKISYLIADTEEERTRGLSGRESLEPNQAMLFVFEEDMLPNFWMKDMQFPIDIIWVASTTKIISIEESVATSTYPKTFSPTTPARYAIECTAGCAKRHGWSAGTSVTLPPL